METRSGLPVFAAAGNINFKVLPSAHIIGYLGAIATALWTYPQTLRQRYFSAINLKSESVNIVKEQR